MPDPRRWLDSPNATALERELIARELAASPDPNLESSVWDALLTNLPPLGGHGGDPGGSGAGPGVGSAAGAGAKTGALFVARFFAIGALSGAIFATGVTEVSHRLESPAADRSAELAPSSRTRIGEAPPAPQTPATNGTADPRVAPRRPAPGNAPPPAPRPDPAGTQRDVAPTPSSLASARFALPEGAGDTASRTRAEWQLLERARVALQSGDPNAALGWLERARESFGGGMLAQEREVLTIDALAEAGRSADAKARAHAFLQQFPDSPHAGHVRRFVTSSSE